jgi:hypothetical protein
MEASEKLTIQALKAHDKVHPKFKSTGRSLKQKSRASLLSTPEDPAEVTEVYLHFNPLQCYMADTHLKTGQGSKINCYGNFLRIFSICYKIYVHLW